VLLLVVSGLSASMGVSGCGGRAPARAAGPPPARIDVVVSVFPLAQLTSYIGGSAVDVTDLAPPEVQPQGLTLTVAQRKALGHAALVIDVGDGYQPAVESAAMSARRHLSVLPGVSKQAQPYEFWLDPYLMASAGTLIGSALASVDPAERSLFEDGSRNFAAVANSIESDLESTFTDCTLSKFVTSDSAFSRLAASFSLVDVAVDTTSVKEAAAIVSQGSLPAVFSEVGVPSGQVQAVASSAGVSVKSLNPIELAPEPDAQAPPTYFAAMEGNLTALEGPLDCDTTSGI
jgi:zinc transport system substrate-binding protein